jgi:hypothetical protein
MNQYEGEVLMKLKIVVILIALVMLGSGVFLAWSIGINTPSKTASQNISNMTRWEITGNQIMNPLLQNFKDLTENQFSTPGDDIKE